MRWPTRDASPIAEPLDSGHSEGGSWLALWRRLCDTPKIHSDRSSSQGSPSPKKCILSRLGTKAVDCVVRSHKSAMDSLTSPCDDTLGASCASYDAVLGQLHSSSLTHVDVAQVHDVMLGADMNPWQGMDSPSRGRGALGTGAGCTSVEHAAHMSASAQCRGGCPSMVIAATPAPGWPQPLLLPLISRSGPCASDAREATKLQAQRSTRSASAPLPSRDPPSPSSLTSESELELPLSAATRCHPLPHRSSAHQGCDPGACLHVSAPGLVISEHHTADELQDAVLLNLLCSNALVIGSSEPYPAREDQAGTSVSDLSAMHLLTSLSDRPGSTFTGWHTAMTKWDGLSGASAPAQLTDSGHHTSWPHESCEAPTVELCVHSRLPATQDTALPPSPLSANSEGKPPAGWTTVIFNQAPAQTGPRVPAPTSLHLSSSTPLPSSSCGDMAPSQSQRVRAVTVGGRVVDLPAYHASIGSPGPAQAVPPSQPQPRTWDVPPRVPRSFWRSSVSAGLLLSSLHDTELNSIAEEGSESDGESV